MTTMPDLTEHPPLKLVLDTNIALDFLVFDDASLQPLKALLAQQGAILYANAHTLGELARVLAYPRLALPPAVALEMLGRYAALCTHHEGTDALHTLPQCHDPDDQPFIELAARIPADALLSKDKAVLSLGRQRYQAQLGFRIATPRQFFAA